MTDNLMHFRERINQVDAELLKLLNERANIALEIGKEKSSNGTQVYDPKRERTVIEQLEHLNGGPLSKGAVDEIFTAIIAACRQIQIK